MEEASGSRADSKGGNTLTDNNTVTQDIVNFKQGLASADFEATNSESLSRTDANLDAGFPLKSDDTNKVFSVCLWARFESLPGSGSFQILYSKCDTNNKQSFVLLVYNNGTNTRIRIDLGFNSGLSFESIYHATALSTATWYHVTVTYNNADKSYAIRLKDTNGATIGSDVTGTATLDANKLSAVNADLQIGIINPTPILPFDGLMDEVVVFSDIITSAEATQIAQGVYGVVGNPYYAYAQQ